MGNEDLEIIDLKDLIGDSQDPTSTDTQYDYFLCKTDGKQIYEQTFEQPLEEEECIEHDSNDSNRESADGNDYPDEKSDSDDDYGYQQHKQKRRGSSSDDDCCGDYGSDDEKPSQKWMQPQNDWLTDMIRKPKNGVTAAQTLLESIKNNKAYEYENEDF